MSEGRCDIPCPGDPTQACGGFITAPARRWVNWNEALDRRGAPPNVLLTVFALEDDVIPQPAPQSPSLSLPSAGTTTVVTETATTNTVVTNTVITSTVVTVTYTIVNPTNPGALTITEYGATLTYPYCDRCANQPVPTVSMTTYTAHCNACGIHGESQVTITAPCDAVPSGGSGSNTPGNTPGGSSEGGGNGGQNGEQPQQGGGSQGGGSHSGGSQVGSGQGGSGQGGSGQEQPDTVQTTKTGGTANPTATAVVTGGSRRLAEDIFSSIVVFFGVALFI